MGWDGRARKINVFFLAGVGFDARFPHQNQTKHCWQNVCHYYFSQSILLVGLKGGSLQLIVRRLLQMR